MNLIQEAYSRLFPGKEFPFAAKLSYNLRLSDFNSNLRYYQDHLEVNLNLQWKDIDDEIKIGLIQTLLLKVLKQKKNTQNIELYHNFLKNIPLLTSKNKSDPQLDASFRRVNQQFFEGKLEKPNLEWGSDSHRKLASYNLHRDTVTFSTLFREAPLEMIDYLMYHELLHKLQQFTHKNGRSFFHTREFRKEEKKYPDYENMEKDIQKLLRQKTPRFSLKTLFSLN